MANPVLQWEVLAEGPDGPEVEVIVGELVLKESGALVFNVPQQGWQTVFSPTGWLRADRVG